MPQWENLQCVFATDTGGDMWLRWESNPEFPALCLKNNHTNHYTMEPPLTKSLNLDLL